MDGSDKTADMRKIEAWNELYAEIGALEAGKVELAEISGAASWEYDTLFQMLEDQLAEEAAGLKQAAEHLKRSEEERKEAHARLKETGKDSPAYQSAKERYDAAVLAKGQAKEAKEAAQKSYDLAIRPFSERLNDCLDKKRQASKALSEVNGELRSKNQSFTELSKVCFERTDAQASFDAIMTALVVKSIDVRKKINLLKPIRDAAASILREFISKNPTGWSTGRIEAAKRYLVWVNLKKSHGAMLEDNPSYDYDQDVIVNLLGIAAYLKYSGVAKAKLEAEAKAGNLRDKKGAQVTLEQLEKLRLATLDTPRLKPFALGKLSADDVMITMAQEWRQVRGDMSLADLAASGKLPKATVTALANSGVLVLSQIRCMSLQGLASLPGIGKVRATQLFKLLCK